jgi:ribosomal protein S18 acetylase RimI-like enzyme
MRNSEENRFIEDGVATIRPAVFADTSALVALGEATGIFGPQEANALLGDTLDALHAGQLAMGHQAWVWCSVADGTAGGWVYFAPKADSDASWDLWWIGVDPARHAQGIGHSLLGFVEGQVKSAGGRVLIIETSSLPALAPARRFYQNHGYTANEVVENYYGDGDNKVIFVKAL